MKVIIWVFQGRNLPTLVWRQCSVLGKEEKRGAGGGMEWDYREETEKRKSSVNK